MKHKFAGLLMAGVMMCSMAVSASAAEVTDATQSPAPTTTLTVSTTDTNALTTQSKVPAYPVDIQYPTEEGGLIRKTFVVSSQEDIDLLERGDIEYQGKVYHFQDITVEEIGTHDEKNYIETLTGESDTKDTDKILATLELKREVTTDDGYTGVLDLDASSLTTEVTSYGSTSKTKTVTKSYTGLSDADLTFIPKTVTENGVTCSLVDVNWVETSPYNPYDPDYGNRFNATAKYSGTYSSSYAKGYAYEVKYYGTVEKDEIEGYSCTLLFAPEFEDSHWYDVFVGENANPIAVFGAIVVLCLLLACAAFTIASLIKRRRGQEVTTTEEVIVDDGTNTSGTSTGQK